MKKMTDKDRKFIREVAKDQDITVELTEEDLQKAHKYASGDGYFESKEPADYYYRLKEFFYA